MVDKYHRPCFDSSVFLGGLNSEIVNGIKRDVVFEHLWEKAKNGEFVIFISALSIAEVYKKRAKQVSSDGVLDEFLARLNERFVEVIEIDRETALQAHALCRKYSANKLYPNDALILACALRAKCDVLLAWNGPLNSVTHDDIHIEEPYMIDRQMFTPNERATAEEIAAYERKEIKSQPAVVQGSNSRFTEGQARNEEPRKSKEKEIE